MPKLWDETIEAHRHAVNQAILDTTAALVAHGGLLSVSMSQIAEQVGIGRATLYKYFPDVESILHAWHQQQIAGHLEQLAAIREQPAEPEETLAAVLEAFALIQHGRVRHHDHEPHGAELGAFLHADAQIAPAQQQLHELVRGLLAEAARAGVIRDDVGADELTRYCLHALSAAASLPSTAAVRRIVGVTLNGLRASEVIDGR